jgi:hypothetical protein
LAARFVRDEEVVGSNPATPTEYVQVNGLSIEIDGQAMIIM